MHDIYLQNRAILIIKTDDLPVHANDSNKTRNARRDIRLGGRLMVYVGGTAPLLIWKRARFEDGKL